MSIEGQGSADASKNVEEDVIEADVMEEAQGNDVENDDEATGQMPEAANDEGEPLPPKGLEDEIIEGEALEGQNFEEELEDEELDEDELEASDAQEADEPEEEVIDYELDEEHVRMAEALLFAAAEPLDHKTLADRMPDGIHIPTVLEAVEKRYEGRGVNLMGIAGKYAFRTSPDLSFMMEKERVEQRRLSRAAIETLAIIAYHQPVTRAEIEEIRGVSVSKGTIDVLLEVGWIKLRGRRRVPGRPVTYGTSEDFLDQFGLDTVKDLPGLEELKAAGLLDARLPPGFSVPTPDDTLPPVEEDEEDDQDDLFEGDIATPFDEEEV